MVRGDEGDERDGRKTKGRDKGGETRGEGGVREKCE